MLLPTEQEIDDEKLGRLLKFASRLLEKKYQIYIVKRFSFILHLILFAGSVGLVFYISISLGYGGGRSGQQLLLHFMILLWVPVLYLCSYAFNWSKRIFTYAVFYLAVLLIGSIFYAITTEIEYSMLGILVIQFVALNYPIDYAVFVIFVGVSLAGQGLT